MTMPMMSLSAPSSNVLFFCPCHGLWIIFLFVGVEILDRREEDCDCELAVDSGGVGVVADRAARRVRILGIEGKYFE